MDEIIALVTKWYEKHRRVIPWREDPTAYHIWLSEIMCQQTRIETVIPYYQAFLKTCPTIEDLAWIDEDKLLKLWQGLGYYQRARNLKETAQVLVQQYQGKIPQDFDQLVQLKGIGQYTAGAILSIAYQLPYSAVDGNVLRVLTRVYADDSDINIASTKKKYQKLIETHLTKRPGDFNQGIMDLGAMICLPNGKPACDKCPLSLLCQAHRSQQELDYPKKEKQVKRKVQEYTVLVVFNKDQILLHKRKAQGLLANLYEPKICPGHLDKTEVERLFPNSRIQKGMKKEVLFTHLKWRLIGYKIWTEDYPLKEDEFWVTNMQLQQDYSIPTAFQDYLKTGLDE